MVSSTFKSCGVVADVNTVDQVADNLYDTFATSQCWELFDDVTDFLQNLKKQGVATGIISNFDDRLGKSQHFNSFEM